MGIRSPRPRPRPAPFDLAMSRLAQGDRFMAESKGAWRMAHGACRMAHVDEVLRFENLDTASTRCGFSAPGRLVFTSRDLQIVTAAGAGAML